MTVKNSAESEPLPPADGVLSSGSAPPGAESVLLLPAQPNALLGRAEELGLLSHAILHRGVRLLTLIGPAGVGKSRLAIEVAREIRAAFLDGAVLVDLSGKPDLLSVLAEIVAALHLPAPPDDPALDPLIQFLCERSLVLVLDNLDHDPAAAQAIDLIVERCPDAAVIVTSREPLHVRWEHVQPIGPLSLPDAEIVSPDHAAANPCVRLFVERAQSVRPDFALDASNVGDIVVICRSLDGLPLAIELAAARSNVLTPSAIASRLHSQIDLLGQAMLDIPRHQGSLTAAMGSGYGLLMPEEQALLRQLSVFVDGFTLEAAGAVVAGEPGADILDGMAALVDKSVVVVNQDSGDEPRYHLLQTMHSFVQDLAQAAGELDQFCRAHGNYFLWFAEQACAELDGPLQDVWLARLDRDHSNLRAALAWASRRDVEAEMRLATALTPYWLARGYVEEGFGYLSTAVEHSSDASPAVRGAALGRLAEILRAKGEIERARTAVEEGLVLARSLASPTLVAGLLREEGRILAAQGAVKQGLTRLRAALAGWQSLGEAREVGLTMQDESAVQLSAGALEQAETLAAESASMFRSESAPTRVIVGLLLEARSAALLGDVSRSAALVEEALRLTDGLGAQRLVLLSVESAAWLAAASSRPEPAARLLGAAETGRKTAQLPRTQMRGSVFGSVEDDVRTRLLSQEDSRTVNGWLQAGGQLSVAKMVDEAHTLLADVAARAPTLEGVDAGAVQLSKRETEVLELLVQGFTNRQIADQLGISENTAKFHVTAIRGKLGANNRARIVTLAAELNLLRSPA